MLDTDKNVRIYEVGPRDGLQNEQRVVSTDAKVTLINHLSKAGFSKIEATSFVSPKWVPQMGDAALVMAGINRMDGVTYSALTPNMQGFDAALYAGVKEVAIFGAASETFSQKNINCSISESLERFAPIAAKAIANDVLVRGYISCVNECPYEGLIDPSTAANLTPQLLDMGCYEVSLGDTIGTATPVSTRALLDAVLAIVDPSKIAGHFHDTNGRALENVAVGLEHGVRVFDSAIGGLGGCPYAPGAKGNLSTIALFDMLMDNGWVTGLARQELVNAEEYIQGVLNA